MASVTRSLLYSDALGEVAWLVHVEAPVLGNVVCEELQRHATDKGGQDLRRLGNREHKVRHPLCAFVPLAGVSSTLERVFSRIGPSPRTAMTGQCSSISAIGPCFISPAG